MTAQNVHTAYFDNAATTFPKPDEVYQFMDYFYRNYGVNIGRGQHKLAQNANTLVNETRALLLELFHCSSKKVIFTPSATESINVILQGLEWRDGLNVYISPFEHNAVIRVLNFIQRKYGIKIVELDVDRDTLCYDIEKIKYHFQEIKPNVVIVNHASNVCGLVAPIKEIFDISKKHCAITIVDMAQTTGLIDTNLNEVQADYAVFAGHKTLYAPFGVSGFITTEPIGLKPLIYGGTGVDSANPDQPNEIPDRFEAGSLNIGAIAGLNAALKWIKKTGIDSIYQQEKTNHQKLLNILREFDNLKIIEPENSEETIGVVSCVFDGYSSDNIGQILSDHDIAVRTGLHCAPLAHKFLGTFPAGTVRFSVSYFNNDTDFERLEEVLEFIEENS